MANFCQIFTETGTTSMVWRGGTRARVYSVRPCRARARRGGAERRPSCFDAAPWRMFLATLMWGVLAIRLKTASTADGRASHS